MPLARHIGLLLAALVAIAVACIGFAGSWLGPLEDDTVDVRFALRDQPKPKDIVVVAIDDVTFSKLRMRWPFPRRLHARAVDALRRAGAREIVYDVQFTEPSHDPADDVALYDAAGRAGGLIFATTETDGHGHTNVLGGDERLRAIHARAAASNLDSSNGGVIREVQYSVGGLKSVAVAAYERVSGRAVSPGPFEGRGALIDYRGKPGTFPTVSFSRLLQGGVDPAVFRHKIVVIGVSAPTVQDVHATPTSGSSLMSGPEVQANAIWTVMHGLPLRQAPALLDLLAIALLGLLAPLAAIWLRPWRATAVAVLAGLAYAVACQLVFDAGLVLAVTYPLGSLLLGTGGMVTAGYITENRERERVSRYSQVLEEEVRERTAQLRETQLEVIRRLAQAAESRDDATGRHIERISRMCEWLGRAAGMSETDVELLRHASALHDIGKIAIPDHVLLKPGPLDPDEWEIMKGHTTVGAKMLEGSSSPLVQLAEQVALTHHERWDGSGYPYGLAGKDIPLAGRICSVCDVFDALLSQRPYKTGWTFKAAVTEILDQSGRQFDPELAQLFLQLAPRIYGEFRATGAADDWNPAEAPVPVGASS